MTATFVDGPDEMEWARTVHDLPRETKSAVLHGDVHAPDRVDCYDVVAPLVTDKPFAIVTYDEDEKAVVTRTGAAPAAAPDPVPTFDDDFVRAAADAFLDAVRFGEVDEDGDSYDSEKYDCHDFTSEAVEAARSRVRDFLSQAAVARAAHEAGLEAESFGHDLYFSGAGHGTGFWDRGLGSVGIVLHDAAKVYGGATVTVRAGETLTWN